MVAICVGGLPDAVVPLWHAAQVPLTPEWSNRTFVQELVEWHCSHSPAVWTWSIGLPGLSTPL
ncbi:MAG: hypothetical protein FP825_06960 [Hyphomonas sp.]|nr:hypothetical protein [Hyphomonas sp.]